MAEQRTAQVEVAFDVRWNGEPCGPLKKCIIPLVVPDEATDEKLRWTFELKLQEGQTTENGVTTRHLPSSYPVTLAMWPDDLQAILDSDEPGKAEVVIPLKATTEQGKAIIRDSSDRPQGAVERTFLTVSMDDSPEWVA